MLECCYLLHRLCFDALGFFRLFGQVWADNERAWRLYQFLGWVKEGVRRKHDLAPDGYHDVLVISVFRHEFDAQRKPLEGKLYTCEQPPLPDRRRVVRSGGLPRRATDHRLDLPADPARIQPGREPMPAQLSPCPGLRRLFSECDKRIRKPVTFYGGVC